MFTGPLLTRPPPFRPVRCGPGSGSTAATAAGSALPLVSGARTQSSAAASRMAALIANPHSNDRCSAISPTATEPVIAPQSDIIWNAATAVPARVLLPRMSATAACCGALNMPVAAPVKNAASKNSGSDDVAPSRIVVAPDTDSPEISSVRRPIRSDR